MVMGEFNEITQRAKVAAGYKGGPFNKNPMTMQKMSFVEGWPSEVVSKLQSQNGIYPGGVTDPWVYRKPSSSMR